MKRIAVCIPLSWGFVPTLFFMSWTRLFAQAIHNYDIEVLVSNLTLIDNMREVLAQRARDSTADYVLWLDADQIYPEDTIPRLIKHVDDGCSVVGGVTPGKRDGVPLVYKFDNDEGLGVKDPDFQPNQGLKRVDAMGFGGILMSHGVFDKLSEPYFLRKWSHETNRLIGEDLCFYDRCRKAGVDVWCDTDLHYGHIVSYVSNVTGSPVSSEFAK